MSASHFRVRFGVVSRAAGHSAAKRAAYQMCGTMSDHHGQRFDYQRKAAEHRATIMMLPTDAPSWAADPGELWRRAGAAEKRSDAQEGRTVDLSLPRALPPELYEECARYVFQPLVSEGMAWQIDVQSKAARDGGENPHVHAIGTMRSFEGDGFARKKAREWNEIFRAGGGKDMRAQIAERLTDFCREHGIDYTADPRSNAERDLPAPEPSLPRWNFRAAERGIETAAVVDLDEHRARRRAWRAAQDEVRAAEAEVVDLARERRMRIPAVVAGGPSRREADRKDRRAAVLRMWHQQGEWLHADAARRIARARIDDERGCLWIDTRDGSTLVDTGQAIMLKGRLTRDAAAETAAAAARHGWPTVQITGPLAYRDAVAIEMEMRGITHDHTLSPRAQRELERRKAAAAAAATTARPQPERRDSAADFAAVQAARRRRAAAEPEREPSPAPVPAYVPPWVKKI